MQYSQQIIVKCWAPILLKLRLTAQGEWQQLAALVGKIISLCKLISA